MSQLTDLAQGLVEFGKALWCLAFHQRHWTDEDEKTFMSCKRCSFTIRF